MIITNSLIGFYNNTDQSSFGFAPPPFSFSSWRMPNNDSSRDFPEANGRQDANSRRNKQLNGDAARANIHEGKERFDRCREQV